MRSETCTSVRGPGKELLQPIAVVILGGLVFSTFLSQVVMPALFWVFSRKEWESYVPGTHVDVGGFDEMSLTDHALEAVSP
ncbi:MAG: hypothetical protein H7Y17_05665 [Chlorobia bacterium]|nr:hypothetical protein [Fimbriimonadaceae bacterium]